jgi:hypothetical protein
VFNVAAFHVLPPVRILLQLFSDMLFSEPYALLQFDCLAFYFLQLGLELPPVHWHFVGLDP